MELIETTYTVTLRDYPEELPARERIAAETEPPRDSWRLFGLSQAAIVVA